MIATTRTPSPPAASHNPYLRFEWSTLNSSRASSVILLALLVLLSLAAEVSARFAFPKISRIRQRIETEREIARHLKSEPQKPAIFVIGNSLFERGVDINSLQTQLSDYKVVRFVMSDTSYFDWYYGLKRLFSEGARPQAVILGLTARQLLTNRIEGSLSTNLLIRTADIAHIAQDLNKSNTGLSNMYFDNLSAFYGGSTQFRKWLLATELMPDLQRLSVALSPSIQPLPQSSEIIRISSARLLAISEVCREYGARFILVVPPSPSQSEAQFGPLKQAGYQSGVDVLAPAENQEFAASLFSDGLHLNSAGENKFTLLLASSLKQKLSDRVNAQLSIRTETRTETNRFIK